MTLVITAARRAEILAGQALLHAIAHDQPLPVPGGPDEEQIQRRALRRLSRLRVLVEDGSRHRFAIPLVARWVRERAVPDDEETLW